MSSEYRPYNPLDQSSIADSLARATLDKTPVPLAGLSSFVGVGTYVLYYVGPFPAYAALTERDPNGHPFRPIYIGKADLRGRRTGISSSDDDPTARPGAELFTRLAKHRTSIEAVNNLDVNDFLCRYLVIEPLYAALGEAMLIRKYMPVWNSVIDGFGNNDPGRGRYAGMAPKWDVLHPGRAWASRCQPRGETQAQIAAEAEQYIRERL